MKNLVSILATLTFGFISSAWANGPADWTFDQARLGQGFSEEFIRKIALVPPCDIDPINDGARSIAFFTAKPCRSEGMTEKTTVVLFTSPAITRENSNPPVTAIAWMGGTFMNTRSNFPVRVGAQESEANTALGLPLETVSFEEDEMQMSISKHEGQIFSLKVGTTVVGFVVGEMPSIDFESEDHEEWGAIVAAWFRFTAPVQESSPTPPETPGQPSNPSDPSPPTDPQPTPNPITEPYISYLVETFMNTLLQRLDEKVRFQTLVPLLHSSLVRKDKTDFAPGIREYAYRRALKNAPFYIEPISVEKVQRGQPTAIGSGPSAETGRIDKIFLRRKPSAGGGSAPIHIFIPTAGNSAPSILHFGSL